MGTTDTFYEHECDLIQLCGKNMRVLDIFFLEVNWSKTKVEMLRAP